MFNRILKVPITPTRGKTMDAAWMDLTIVVLVLVCLPFQAVAVVCCALGFSLLRGLKPVTVAGKVAPLLLFTIGLVASWVSAIFLTSAAFSKDVPEYYSIDAVLVAVGLFAFSARTAHYLLKEKAPAQGR